MVYNKEVFNDNVVGAPDARGQAVVKGMDYDMIILIDDILFDLVLLIPQEVPRPDNLRQGVTDAHYFCFIAALGIDFTSYWCFIDAALDHHLLHFCMNSHVVVHFK